MYEWIKAKPVRFKCTFYILVDKGDIQELNQYEWFVKITHTCGTYYAFTYIDGKQISMHQLIMNPDGGCVVHHQNGVGLYNFKGNLKNLKAKEH